MPVSEICSNDSDKCYKVDLTITSDFDNKDEEASFKRNSTICSECKNKINNCVSKSRR
jgi:hypothetical protein